MMFENICLRDSKYFFEIFNRYTGHEHCFATKPALRMFDFSLIVVILKDIPVQDFVNIMA